MPNVLASYTHGAGAVVGTVGTFKQLVARRKFLLVGLVTVDVEIPTNGGVSLKHIMLDVAMESLPVQMHVKARVLRSSSL